MLTYLIDPVLCAWYLAIVFVMFLHLPVPKYEGPSEVIALTPACPPTTGTSYEGRSIQAKVGVEFKGVRWS